MTRENKSTRMRRFLDRLEALGFTTEEAHALRRAQLTLHRWSEAECGDSNSVASWCIERDETTGKPFRVVHRHTSGKPARYPVPDRERGALRRVDNVVKARNDRTEGGLVFSYHQTDPRGCALYLIPADRVPAGASLDSCYSNGVAVSV